MEKLIRPGRLAFMAFIMAALIAVSTVTLYKLQIVDGRKYSEESLNTNFSRQRIAAARGSMMDRYGRVLVEDRVCNNLVIDEAKLFGDGSDEAIAAANDTILTLVNTILAYGDTYIDTLPITRSPPFEYTAMSDIQAATLDAYRREKAAQGDLAEDAGAVELMAYMRSRYRIDNSYTAEETRIIAGVRYEVNSRYIHDFHTSDYVFARDVSMDLIAALMENNVSGFDVKTSFVRDYHTAYGSQILGYTGMMFDDEVEKYRELGYALDAAVGKSGAEYAFEHWLHGTDGEARVTTVRGVVTSTVYTQETIPGGQVYLTLDFGLQEATENALNSHIVPENEERQRANDALKLYGGREEDYTQLITGGAAVVVKVDTGEPLAIASWPSYDIPSLLSDYNSVASAANSPMYNRALQAPYPPGSTFKPCVAAAALSEGKIEPTTTIDCTGIYEHYADIGYSPRCWIYDDANRLHHGLLNLSEAITNSCNIYFYTIGDYLQISAMAKYAKAFGLGEHTGIELYEETGQMTSDEMFQRKYGRDVYGGEAIAAAIGQAESEFTTIQLAEYCAALANNGYRHGASILKNVYSYDFSEVLYQRETELLSSVEMEQEYYDAIHLGMRGVVTDPVVGSAYAAFADAPYTVAAKTGTAQRGEGQTNNAVFMCYAPYENPQVAVAIAVEKGVAGSSLAYVAREILDYYFAFEDSTVALEAEGTLLR